MLQAERVVDVVTIDAIRRASPGVVIATWCGDIASENSVWGFDGKSNLDGQVALGRACDLVLHSSMSHVRALRAAGVHNAAYLQIGYDQEQYRTQDAGEVITSWHDLDICFLGSRYDGDDAFSRSMMRHDSVLRDEVVRKTRDTFGDKFGLFGRGWAKLLGGEDVVVPLADAHRAYWRSKIGLNVSLANFLEMYSSDRLHRVLGCGCLLLTKTFPGMVSWGLVDGENCLAWDTSDEAVAKAREVLADEPRSARIAAAGHELALKNMTWDVRMLELVPYLEAVRKSRT